MERINDWRAWRVVKYHTKRMVKKHGRVVLAAQIAEWWQRITGPCKRLWNGKGDFPPLIDAD